ncbi:MAG: nuclear transport factor 2 family protein [Ilumatobacteraceae bacterium]
MNSDFERRLGRLEDLTEIQQLFIDYGRSLDDGDIDRYASLFTDDGRVDLGPIGCAQGPADIRLLMQAVLAGLVGRSFHLVTSPQVQLDGDEARATVMWTVIHRDRNGTPQVTMIGKHHDRLRRENGRWRFAERRGTIDIPNRYPGSPSA